MFKIWYMTILYSSLLFSASHVMLGFVCKKMLQGNFNYSPYRSFLSQEMKKTLRLDGLSNEHNEHQPQIVCLLSPERRGEVRLI
jgi:hypothetical protein